MQDDRIDKLEAEIKQLTAQNADLKRALDGIRDALLRRLNAETKFKSKMVGRLARVEHTSADTAHLVKSILTSRIWKSLQKGGETILNLVQLAKGKRRGIETAVSLSEAERREHIQLRADRLPHEPKEPAAGMIEITGWALAPDGIAKVEIRVGEYTIPDVQYGILRSDVLALLPNTKGSGNSGYLAGFDTRELKDGAHTVTITATSGGGKKREIHAPLTINQDMGKISEYARWVEIFDQREAELIQLQLDALHFRPKFSVLVPVFRTNLRILQETIDSVVRQSYTNWELCLVDDGSGTPGLTALLEMNSKQDGRIRFMTRGEGGGISAASNDALAMSTGEYIALLDHDDTLSEDALFHVVQELQEAPRADLLYSDEDHMDETGRRFGPFFKPDWSPDLILSENYVCHLMVFQRELGVKAGGFRTEYDVSQDHDILLRMSKQAQRIVHIPRVLYHWRTVLHSMNRASDADDGEKALRSSRGAVESFVNGFAKVEDGVHPGRWRVRYPIPAGSRVSILIPTAGKIQMLERNLKSLWSKAGHDDYEVVVIDNSKSNEVEKYVDELHGLGRSIRRFDQRGKPFNYSRLNNLAVATCDTPLLLFLNDDTEGISEGWLTAMVELAMRPEVGAVGAKLLYPSGLIQHGGVTMGLSGICGHAFKGLEGAARYYYDFPDIIRNVSAVTAACVMVRADVFRSVNGFDETMFPIAYNDIDLSLRIGAAGYRVLYTPHALLYHFEAFSKSEADYHPHPGETLALKTRWRDVIARDPFYNPNLTKLKEDWSLGWD